MSEDYVWKKVPIRKDGTQMAFWYDPDYPGHIVHNPPDSDELRLICVGHSK